MRPSAASASATCRKEEPARCARATWSTREEKHSTRGRARLLFEMLRGDAIEGGWRNEEVKRGARPLPGLQGLQAPSARCTSTWPRTRPSSSRTTTRAGSGPRHAYAMGLIYWWARLASRMRRGWSNPSRTAPVSASWSRWLAGISTASGRRRRSRARRSRSWFRRGARGTRGRAARDPLARHVQQPLPPARSAKAAVEVLEAAGFRGRSCPRAALCCGRPLYDFGMLDAAQAAARADPRRAAAGDRARARRSSASSRAAWPSSATSCVNMLPDDEDAKRLAQPDVLAGRVPRRSRRRTTGRRSSTRKALVQGTATTKPS